MVGGGGGGGGGGDVGGIDTQTWNMSSTSKSELTLSTMIFRFANGLDVSMPKLAIST